MKKQDLCRQLQELDCPSIDTPLYRQCLREVIMSQPKSKRERIYSLLESGCQVLVGSRVAVTGVGLSLSVLLLFVGYTYGDDDSVVTQVSASEIVTQMERASQDMSESHRSRIEAQLQMDLQQLLEQAQASRMQLVFDIDPQTPVRVMDSRRQQVHLVNFYSDEHGYIKVQKGPRLAQLMEERMATMAASHKVLQYVSDEGQIVMVTINESHQPQSGIVLAGN